MKTVARTLFWIFDLESPSSYRKSRKHTNVQLIKFFIQLIPILLTSLALYFLKEKVENIQVGNKSFYEFLMLVALSAPVLSQLSCTPLYIKLGDEIYKNGKKRIPDLLISGIPTLWMMGTLASSILGIIFYYFSDWSLKLSLYYVLSCSLHILFAQLMIYGSILRRWKLWIGAWLMYTVALITFPEQWFLAPIMASGFMFTGIFVNLGSFPKPTFEKRFFWGMLRGLALGLILWIDKLILYAIEPKNFDPALVFTALIPTVLVLNYYYVFITPRVEKSLEEVIKSMTTDPVKVFMEKRKITFQLIRKSIMHVALINLVINVVFTAFALRYSPAAPKLIKLIYLHSAMITFSSVILNGLLLVRSYKTFYFFCFYYFILVGISFAIFDTTTVYIVITKLFLAAIIWLIYTTLKKWEEPQFIYLK